VLQLFAPVGLRFVIDQRLFVELIL